MSNQGQDKPTSCASSLSSSLTSSSTLHSPSDSCGALALDYDEPLTPNVSPIESYNAKQTYTLQPSPKLVTYQTTLILDETSIRNFYGKTKYWFENFSKDAARVGYLQSLSLEEVVRIALWWFLHGRMKLVPLLREGVAFPFAQNDNKILLRQAHMNLAKCLWIIEETRRFKNLNVEETNETDELPETELLSLRLALLIGLRCAVLAMQKHGIFPESSLTPIDLDDSLIYVPYQHMVYLTIRHHLAPLQTEDLSISKVFPLKDTAETFHYGGIHVNLELPSTSVHEKVPAIMSVVRSRDQRTISAVCGNQDGKISFVIEAAGDCRWRDASWKTTTTTLEITFKTGFRMNIQFGAWDFKVLKGIYDHERDALDSFEVSNNETLVFETSVEHAQYGVKQIRGTKRFPLEEIANCRLRLFEKKELKGLGTGSSKLHCGYRISILTPTWVKDLRVFSEEIFPSQAVRFGFLGGEPGSKAISLQFEREDLMLCFSQPEDCVDFLAHLTGIFLHEHEHTVTRGHLNSVNSFKISSCMEPLGSLRSFGNFQWQSLRVIAPKAEESQRGLCESLRIIVDSSTGRLTDRINVGLGELKVRRNVISSGHELQILRQPQEDLTFTVSDLTVGEEFTDAMHQDLHTLRREPSVRTYTFPNLAELHAFQEAVTGFKVLYDGVPSSFSISRRRSMIPRAKAWTPLYARLQILNRGKVRQLVAYFQEFSHGKCMNFRLKETDVFEKSKKGGLTILKFVDAKFSLPAGGKNDPGLERGFVCLDLLEYPGEHSNLYLGFDSNSEFVKFAEALPRLVKG